jgi:hypothetical protein
MYGKIDLCQKMSGSGRFPALTGSGFGKFYCIGKKYIDSLKKIVLLGVTCVLPFFFGRYECIKCRPKCSIF